MSATNHIQSRKKLIDKIRWGQNLQKEDAAHLADKLLAEGKVIIGPPKGPCRLWENGYYYTIDPPL